MKFAIWIDYAILGNFGDLSIVGSNIFLTDSIDYHPGIKYSGDLILWKNKERFLLKQCSMSLAHTYGRGWGWEISGNEENIDLTHTLITNCSTLQPLYEGLASVYPEPKIYLPKRSHHMAFPVGSESGWIGAIAHYKIPLFNWRKKYKLFAFSWSKDKKVKSGDVVFYDLKCPNFEVIKTKKVASIDIL